MADAGADLGVVRVRIEGKDMGLSKIMSNLADVTAKSTQEIQKLGDAHVDLDNSLAKAQNKTLSFIQAILRQRNASNQMQDGLEYVTSQMDQFTDQSLQSARASAIFQGQLKKTKETTVDSALQFAQMQIGTERFAAAATQAAEAISKLDKESKKQYESQNKLLSMITKHQKASNDNRKAIENQAKETLRLAQAQAKVQAASGNTAAAATTLSRALQQVSQQTRGAAQSTTWFLSAQAQLQTYIRRTNVEANRMRGTLFNLVKGLNSYVGAFYALRSVFANVGAFVTAGNELEKTNFTIRALSQSQSRYNEILQVAYREQNLYGGSLRQNMQDLTGFIYLSNQTGVSLQNLLNIAKRLAILDPTQGISGASVALKEFFSGDIQSLSRRFEIDRNTLNSMKDLTTSVERLAALDELLTNMGIGQDVIVERANLTAAAFDKAAGAGMDFYDSLGMFAAARTEGIANGITAVFSGISDLLRRSMLEFDAARLDFIERNRELQSSLSEPIGAGSAARLKTFTEYYKEFLDLQREATRAGMPPGLLQALSEDAFNAAQAMNQLGVSTEEAIALAQSYAGGVDRLSNILRSGLAGSIENSTIKQEQANSITNNLTAKIILLSSQYPGLVSHINSYIKAINNGSVSTLTAEVSIMRLVNQEVKRLSSLQTNIDLQNSVNEKISAYKQAAELAISTTIEATAQSDILGASQELLAVYAQAAAEGLITTAEAAKYLGSEFGYAEDQAYLLVGALEEVRNIQGKTKLIANMDRFNLTLEKINELQNDAAASGKDMTDIYNDYLAIAEANEDRIRELNALYDAQSDYNYSLLDTAGKINFLQNRLKNFNQTQAEYWNILKDIKDLERQLANERSQGGGGAAPDSKSLSAVEDLYYELKDIQDEFYKDSEQAERDHQQKMLDIYNEFAKKQKAAERINETDKRKSRASFYESLMGIEGIDTQAFSTQYEAAFAEAQRIAQEGKASLSKEFLSLRQDQIDQMIQLEQELADVRGDDKLTESEKQSRIEYIKGIMRLYEDAHQEELKQLMESGDENANQLQEQLKAEQQAYADQTQEIAKKASEQADAKVTAAERSKKAIVSENDLLREQYLLIKNITDLKTEGAVAVAPIVTPPAPIPSSMPETVPMTAIAPPQGVSYVHDQVVNNTLIVLGSRLEGKLTELTARMEAGLDILGGHLLSIDRGISRLPTTSLTSR